MFRLVLAEGRSLIRQRDEIEARSVELLSDLPDYQLLTTIPGIDPINAMTILAEAGDLRRIRHHRQFLKFCGMDLATVQSGMFRFAPIGEARTGRRAEPGMRVKNGQDAQPPTQGDLVVGGGASTPSVSEIQRAAHTRVDPDRVSNKFGLINLEICWQKIPS